MLRLLNKVFFWKLVYALLIIRDALPENPGHKQQCWQSYIGTQQRVKSKAHPRTGHEGPEGTTNAPWKWQCNAETCRSYHTLLINWMNNWCICWFFTRNFTGILIFKRITARRLYKSFSVKALIRVFHALNSGANGTSSRVHVTLWLLYKKVKMKQSHCMPWEALRVPGGWGSQILRQSAHEGGKVISPTHRPLLLPENISGTHFRWRLSRPQGHSPAGRIMSMKNSNDTIGNWSRDFTVYSSVPQPLGNRVPPFTV
jgi:hypothetical protein